MNWIVIPTLASALLLFSVGERTIRRYSSLKSRAIFLVLSLFMGIPGFLLPLYYFHWFDNAVWFYEFRSLPFTELTAAGAGLFAGAFAECLKGLKLASRPFLLALLTLGIVAPHLKPLLAPVPNHRFSEMWQNNVCMQSTPSSCGAASAATIFKSFGVSLSEQALARECFTCLGGTENWYIARAFRRRGFTVNYRLEKSFPDKLQTPAIAGVRVGGIGHFITILDKTDGVFVTGDPLVGKEKVPGYEMDKRFDFTGFFMEIGRES